MNRNIKERIKTIHYPKKKIKLDASKVIFDIPEPERKSIYDIVKENFAAMERKTFVHRLIYFGQRDHLMLDKFDDIVRSTVDIVNQNSYEPLTGFFLVYKHYFIHIIEGDEDTIHKHVQLFLIHPHIRNQVSTVKILLEIPHNFRRLTKDWKSFYGMPPKLMVKLSTEYSAEDVGRQIYLCVRKLYNLVNLYLKDLEEFSETDIKSPSLPSTAPTTDSTPRISLATSLAASVGKSLLSLRTATNLGGTSKDRYRTHLPEPESLRYILESQYLQSLQSYSKLYMNIQPISYSELSWPIPLSLVPFDVFDTPYATITELLKTVNEERGNDELGNSEWDTATDENEEKGESSSAASNS